MVTELYSMESSFDYNSKRGKSETIPNPIE